jgi:hypothetical protein
MATARQTTRSAPRKPAPARAGRESAARRKTNPRFAYDLAGVGLIAVALIVFATLLYPPSRSGDNIFGAAVVAGLRLLIGAGAWVFPLVLFVSGVMLAVGRSRSWDNIGGAVALFLLFVTWWHLGNVPIAGQFATDNLLNYGGYLGAALSWGVRSAVGTVGGHITLGALTVTAFLYLTDIPLPSLLGPFERFVVSGAKASGSGISVR